MSNLRNFLKGELKVAHKEALELLREIEASLLRDEPMRFCVTVRNILGGHKYTCCEKLPLEECIKRAEHTFWAHNHPRHSVGPIVLHYEVFVDFGFRRIELQQKFWQKYAKHIGKKR